MMTSVEPRVHPDGRYNVTETAKLLGIDRATVYRWMKNGKLKNGYRRCDMRPFFRGIEILKVWRACY